MNNQSQIEFFTIVACSIIAIAFGLAWLYIATTGRDKFVNHKKWIEQLPSVISTLGVLGTFLGITIGLMSFDTQDLDKSIPKLLDGLKTAFFTSLFGMTGSLILNRIVSHKFDKEDNKSEVEKAANLIVDALKTNHNNLSAILKENNKDLVRLLAQDDTITSILSGIEQIKDDVEEIKGHIEELKGQNSKMIASINSGVEELPRLRAVGVTATASISSIDNNFEDIKESLSNIETAASEFRENVETLKSDNEED